MGKEIAGDPQHLDPSLTLQLESKVCYFIQIPVGLLQGGAFRSHIPGENRGHKGLFILANCTGKSTFEGFCFAQHNWTYPASSRYPNTFFRPLSVKKYNPSVTCHGMCNISPGNIKNTYYFYLFHQKHPSLWKGDFYSHSQLGEELKSCSQSLLSWFHGTSFVPGPVEGWKPKRISPWEQQNHLIIQNPHADNNSE